MRSNLTRVCSESLHSDTLQSFGLPGEGPINLSVYFPAELQLSPGIGGFVWQWVGSGDGFITTAVSNTILCI